MTVAAPSFNGRPKSRGYVPRAYGFPLDYNDQRPWFRLVDVERMRRDPRIMFGLRVLRAPLWKLQWKVNAKSEQVRAFVDQQLRMIWSKCLIKLSAINAWGYVPGEWLYNDHDNGYVEFKDLLTFHPFDAEPLTCENRLVGLELSGVQHGQGKIRIGRPNHCWAIHDQEYNEWRGRSRLLNAWTPWMEKTGRHGALDIRRLWFLKNAYHSAVIRHPDGTLISADGTVVNNQDYARELVEKMETGGHLVLPGDWDDLAKQYQWQIEWAETHGDVSGLLEYPKDLDREILEGMGIPPEVVQTTGDAGSGYAGRSVPARVFYVSLDETASSLVHGCIDPQCIQRMARHNFGAEAEYEIELESMLPPAELRPLEAMGEMKERDELPEKRPAVAAGANAGRQASQYTTSLSMADEAANEARRKYPLGSWVMTADGQWVRFSPSTNGEGLTVALSQSSDEEEDEVTKAALARIDSMQRTIDEFVNRQTLQMSMATVQPQQTLSQPTFNLSLADGSSTIAEAVAAGLRDGFAAMPAPVVHVAAPVVNLPELPSLPVPVVHVAAPIVNVPPFPEIPAQQPPVVHVHPPSSNKRVEEIKDRKGNPTGSFRIVTE